MISPVTSQHNQKVVGSIPTSFLLGVYIFTKSCSLKGRVLLSPAPILWLYLVLYLSVFSVLQVLSQNHLILFPVSAHLPDCWGTHWSVYPLVYLKAFHSIKGSSLHESASVLLCLGTLWQKYICWWLISVFTVKMVPKQNKMKFDYNSSQQKSK